VSNNPLVYFVTHGPQPAYTQEGKQLWQVQAKASTDGKTVEDVVLTFDTQENALRFKRDVNYTMEPTKLWDEEEDE